MTIKEAENQINKILMELYDDQKIIVRSIETPPYNVLMYDEEGNITNKGVYGYNCKINEAW